MELWRGSDSFTARVSYILAVCFRLCAEAMQKGLAESADVRKLAISLKATEYGGELTGKLLAVSKELENLYEGYIDLKARKVKDEKLYQQQLDIVNAKFKFTEKAKAAQTKQRVLS